MSGKTLIVLGASFVLSAVSGCSGGDTAAGSSITQTKGGSGGGGGEAGSLSLGVAGGGTGGGGAAAVAGSAGAGVAGGAGGALSQGGSASGSGGSHSGGSTSGGGGSKPSGMCKRVSGNDADCADFDDTTPQAYACDDAAAYVSLNGMHDNACSSVNFVTGSKYGACCPP